MAKEESQCPVMTIATGAPVADNQNSLTTGARGPGPVVDNPPGAR